MTSASRHARSCAASELTKVLHVQVAGYQGAAERTGDVFGEPGLQAVIMELVATGELV